MICQIDFELLSMELCSAEWTDQNNTIEIWFKIWFATHFSFTFYSFVPLIPFSLFIVETKRMRSFFYPLSFLSPEIDNLIFAISSTWWGLSCAVSLLSVRYSEHFRDFLYSCFVYIFFLLYIFCYDSVEHYVVAILSRIKVLWKLKINVKVKCVKWFECSTSLERNECGVSSCCYSSYSRRSSLVFVAVNFN